LPQALFAVVDADGDGFISVDELADSYPALTGIGAPQPVPTATGGSRGHGRPSSNSVGDDIAKGGSGGGGGDGQASVNDAAEGGGGGGGGGRGASAPSSETKHHLPDEL
jgi:single-strand DNA-binding protein